ncbi:MAG: hypothetical protein EAZ08_04205 [Cytophagales bacterium]|nr:MAG: hypothetical protein EAZ08_04205 [Cytophagales bacterium]
MTTPENHISIIYDSQYQTLLYHTESGIFEEIWKEGSRELTDELYQEDFLKLIKVGFRIPFNKVLIDHREFHFTISPELQTWHLENIFSVSIQYVTGKTKVANLVTPDFYAQLSIEQTFEEVKTDKFIDFLYFDDRIAAVRWLLK